MSGFTAVGAGIGAISGASAGGALGGVGGGLGGTLVAPGAGTFVGAVVGVEAGTPLGAFLGGGLGAGVGYLVGQVLCSKGNTEGGLRPKTPGANANDGGQIRAAAKQIGVDPRRFGDFVEAEKQAENRVQARTLIMPLF